MAKIDYIVRYLLIIKKVKDSNELGINPSMEEIIRYVNEEMEQRGGANRLFFPDVPT